MGVKVRTWCGIMFEKAVIPIQPYLPQSKEKHRVPEDPWGSPDVHLRVMKNPVKAIILLKEWGEGRGEGIPNRCCTRAITEYMASGFSLSGTRGHHSQNGVGVMWQRNKLCRVERQSWTTSQTKCWMWKVHRRRQIDFHGRSLVPMLLRRDMADFVENSPLLDRFQIRESGELLNHWKSVLRILERISWGKTKEVEWRFQELWIQHSLTLRVDSWCWRGPQIFDRRVPSSIQKDIERPLPKRTWVPLSKSCFPLRMPLQVGEGRELGRLLDRYRPFRILIHRRSTCLESFQLSVAIAPKLLCRAFLNPSPQAILGAYPLPVRCMNFLMVGRRSPKKVPTHLVGFLSNRDGQKITMHNMGGNGLNNWFDQRAQRCLLFPPASFASILSIINWKDFFVGLEWTLLLLNWTRSIGPKPPQHFGANFALLTWK